MPQGGCKRIYHVMSRGDRREFGLADWRWPRRFTEPLHGATVAGRKCRHRFSDSDQRTQNPVAALPPRRGRFPPWRITPEIVSVQGVHPVPILNCILEIDIYRVISRGGWRWLGPMASPAPAKQLPRSDERARRQPAGMRGAPRVGQRQNPLPQVPFKITKSSAIGRSRIAGPTYRLIARALYKN